MRERREREREKERINLVEPAPYVCMYVYICVYTQWLRRRKKGGYVCRCTNNTRLVNCICLASECTWSRKCMMYREKRWCSCVRLDQRYIIKKRKSFSLSLFLFPLLFFSLLVFFLVHNSTIEKEDCSSHEEKKRMKMNIISWCMWVSKWDRSA
jgi:hypothetical protein